MNAATVFELMRNADLPPDVAIDMLMESGEDRVTVGIALRGACADWMMLQISNPVPPYPRAVSLCVEVVGNVRDGHIERAQTTLDVLLVGCKTERVPRGHTVEAFRARSEAARLAAKKTFPRSLELARVIHDAIDVPVIVESIQRTT